jgi:hypothetical protein
MSEFRGELFDTEEPGNSPIHAPADTLGRLHRSVSVCRLSYRSVVHSNTNLTL